MPTDTDSLGPMATEVARSLQTLPAESGDAAVKALAMEYAAAIDAAARTDVFDPLAVYGPKLLSALQALRLTPAARTIPGKEASPGDSTPAGALARLRQGAHGASHLHSAPTGTDA